MPNPVTPAKIAASDHAALKESELKVVNSQLFQEQRLAKLEVPRIPQPIHVVAATHLGDVLRRRPGLRHQPLNHHDLKERQGKDELEIGSSGGGGGLLGAISRTT